MNRLVNARIIVVCVAAALLSAVVHAGETQTAAAGAPVNPFNGIQDRVETYEFTAKPKVEKAGGKWIISFTSKAACDATVTISGKDGVIIRHLASGVLGKNAPYPFQQDSLSQKIEWDGLKDDFSKADAAGCTVKVGLGLKATYEKSLLWDPYDLPRYPRWGERPGVVYTAADDAGNIYVVASAGNGCYGRMYAKDGKYVRTFWPPSAAEYTNTFKAAGLGVGWATTTWGDKVPVSLPASLTTNQWPVLLANMGLKGVKVLQRAPTCEVKESELVIPYPGGITNFQSSLPKGMAMNLFAYGKVARVTADPVRDEIHVSYGGSMRVDGKTGLVDPAWKTAGMLDRCFGPDGLLYAQIGEHGRWIVRYDHDGKPVPFKENAGMCNGIPVLLTGDLGEANTQRKGLGVSPNGTIVAIYGLGGVVDDVKDPASLKCAMLPSASAVNTAKKEKIKGIYDRYVVMAWDKDGKRLGQDIIEGALRGHGVYMDRDGNVYLAQVHLAAAGQTMLDGIADVKNVFGSWGGYGGLVKFRGLGGKYPLGTLMAQPNKDFTAPADSLALNCNGKKGGAVGGLWIYGGLSDLSVFNNCCCGHTIFQMDLHARSWIPARQLCSIMVVDSNGNRMARLGRYGNVDDSETDIKAGKDGLRFYWTKSIGVNDNALYAHDQYNFRILKAKLGFAAEETLPVQ